MMTWRAYPLTVGLPQTNYRGLAEARLLMEAGNVFWWALGDAIQRPIAQLRSASGEPVYATIVFVEERFPPMRTLSTFRLDDQLNFLVHVRAMRNLAVEGRVVFNRAEELASLEPDDAWWQTQSSHPSIRFGSIFATPGPTASQLKLSPPVNATFHGIPPLPLEHNPIQLTRVAQDTGRLGVIPDGWIALDSAGPTCCAYDVDPDRDTNAAGLVYFANFIAMMEQGERMILHEASSRHLLQRCIAYYGNAGLTDRITIELSRWGEGGQPEIVGLRFRLTRAGDAKLICLSEAILSLAPPSSSARSSSVGQYVGLPR